MTDPFRELLENRKPPEPAPARQKTPDEELAERLAKKLLKEKSEANARATALKTIDPSETRDWITKEEFRAVLDRVMLKAPPR